MRRLTSTVFCAAVFLTSCAGNHKPTTPPPASGSEMRADILERELAWMNGTVPLLRMEPLPAYLTWRHEVERCSGHTRDGWPRFYISAMHTMPGGMSAFYTNRPPTIVFAVGHEVYAGTVRHELLHFLVEPDTSHTSEPWLRCMALLTSSP